MSEGLRISLKRVYYRIFRLVGLERLTTNRFHKLYYDLMIFGRTVKDTKWLGTNVLKCPMDLMVYHEIIYEKKPDVIIECGTCYGGSTIFFASMLDLINKGKVISVDIDYKPNRPKHKRITYLHGSSTDPKIVEKIKSMIKKGDKVMVVLDSDHSKRHVLNELNTYRDIVSKGQYMVVEDTNVNGHPVLHFFSDDPMGAVKDFVKNNDKFVVDKSREKLLLTFNPSGWLLKVK